jgi:peptidyl-prolyl cis-trans isomerase D
MFEFIRTHKRLMQLFLLLLILPSFVLVGVSSYKSDDNGVNVATVDGNKVTQTEWESAQRKQLDIMRQRMGEQFDQKQFDTPETKRAILDNLVAEKAVEAEIKRSHLTVSDATLQAFYQERFKGDVAQYQAIAAQLGLTTPGLDQLVKRDMAVQQVSSAIQGSAFAPRAVAARLSDINDQEREVQELLLPTADFIAQVKVSDDMVKAYYEKNAAMFAIPEQIKAEYVIFSPDVVEGQVSVSDAEVAEAYAKDQKRYTTPEQRVASHILINLKKDASSADVAAAQAKAKGLLDTLRKSPDQFAALAKTQSQDPGSAEQGGDLGTVEKGAFVAPVEEAIYKLKQGEISDIVRSDFGLHIITVTKIVPVTVKPLADVQAAIAADLKKQKMSKKYSELAESFTNTVDDQSDSLKPVADKLKLKIETVSNLGRTPPPGQNVAPFTNAKFLKAIFADDAVKAKHNTAAVEVAPSTLMAGRVLEYKPASKRPLAEVDAMIRQRVTLEEAVKLATKAGETKMAAAKAAGDATGFGEAKVISRTKEPGINPIAAIAVLKADVSKLPAYVGVELPGQGYGIYRIAKAAAPATVDTARRANEAQQIAGVIAEQEMFNYVQALKTKAKAKVLIKADAATAAPVAK